MARSREVILDNDIVKLRDVKPNKKGAHPVRATLFWGDRVRVIRRSSNGSIVSLAKREWNEAKHTYEQTVYECILPKQVKFRDNPLLKVRFIDVGQGDGAIVESPNGNLVLIDGGEETHMRRYMTAAFSYILQRKSIPCDAIIVSHGDADHFAGLIDVANARRNGSKDPFIKADRVFHNGLVKKSGKSLGRTRKNGRTRFVTDLYNDLRDVNESAMNKTFKNWKSALRKMKSLSSGKVQVKRIEYGQDDVFSFWKRDGITVDVLGPICDRINGKPALPWLGDAGKTINGHSVVLRVGYGNVRFLFGADLNEPSQERLLERTRQDQISLTAEILKVPHHGSADFSPRMVEAIKPVVSVVSSGDENSAKEYIHPRAGLVGALGRFSRGTVDKPLVYVTEMVAFFKRNKNSFRDYTKTQYGIVHVRTDGKRVLVVTNSGRDDKKEAYAFDVNERGEIQFEDTVRPI
jgi:beta-lactamase superfamily II metal-dependent hydrolase